MEPFLGEAMPGQHAKRPRSNAPLRLVLEGLEDRRLLSGLGMLPYSPPWLAAFLNASFAPPGDNRIDASLGNSGHGHWHGISSEIGPGPMPDGHDPADPDPSPGQDNNSQGHGPHENKTVPDPSADAAEAGGDPGQSSGPHGHGHSKANDGGDSGSPPAVNLFEPESPAMTLTRPEASLADWIAEVPSILDVVFEAASDNRSVSEVGPGQEDAAAVLAKVIHSSGKSSSKASDATSAAHEATRSKIPAKVEALLLALDEAESPAQQAENDTTPQENEVTLREEVHRLRHLLDVDLSGEEANLAAEKAIDTGNLGSPPLPDGPGRAVDLPPAGEITGVVALVRGGAARVEGWLAWCGPSGLEGAGEDGGATSLLPVSFVGGEGESAPANPLERTEADTLAAFSPDRPAAVDAALQQFLSEVETLGHETIELVTQSPVTGWVVGLAGAVVVVEMARRQRRRTLPRLALAGHPADVTLTWVTNGSSSLGSEDA
jgi:hypothetical protein